MSEDIVERLHRNPTEIFGFQKESGTDNSFNQLLKSLLDPISNKYSILDEIYIDGLDSNQVYGQAKIVLDGVGEKLLNTDIPELKEKYIADEEEEDEEEEEDDEDENEDEDAEEEDEDAEEEDEDANEEEQGDELEVDYEEELGSLENGIEDEDDEEDEDDVDARTLNEEEEVSDAETNIPSDEENQDVDDFKKDSFGLNDGFFDIDEYNKQVLALDEQVNNPDQNNDEEEIDYFANLSGEDDEDEEVDYYDDFYDKPGTSVKTKSQKGKKKKEEEDFDGEFSESEYDNAMGNAMLDLFEDEDEPEVIDSQGKSSENLSSYEKQQLKLQEEIAKLEAELVADKKWTMKGEISAKDRPQDSLLDDPASTDLQFDRTSKPVPIITDEVTETIEDLIRRKVKNEEFDDLPRRLISDVAKYNQAKRDKYELSEQKSSKSLSELYEDEYHNAGTSGTSGESQVSDEVKKQHDEISELFTKVTHKLDALSSAHFVPKPHQFKTIEIKVTDTINMEDAQPLNVTSESQLAPQEVYKIGDDKKKDDQKVLLKSGLSYSKEELSRDEKQRLRRASKRKRSKEYKERQERIEAREAADAAKSRDTGKPNKRQKVSSVVDTLAKAKNITVIDKKGELRDVKGKLKNNGGAQDSNSFKL
ncbi:U3 small nucleolar ribonucleoprotein complex, subunit Mpp10 [Scheffersomyces amazonensis]|uniref:U3 small nucleolar ribonucleoprotein complex, subunit Mpp10 n=1 Tax=Scheffersomyces amazonensis TaxID=1078765 RepID=UPI00315DCA97